MEHVGDKKFLSRTEHRATIIDDCTLNTTRVVHLIPIDTVMVTVPDLILSYDLLKMTTFKILWQILKSFFSIYLKKKDHRDGYESFFIINFKIEWRPYGSKYHNFFLNYRIGRFVQLKNVLDYCFLMSLVDAREYSKVSLTQDSLVDLKGKDF